MNPQDVQTLLDYHYWARDRMLDAVEQLTGDQFTRDLGSSFPSIRDTVVHMFGAERNWYLRWRGESPAALPPNGFQAPPKSTDLITYYRETGARPA